LEILIRVLLTLHPEKVQKGLYYVGYKAGKRILESDYDEATPNTLRNCGLDYALQQTIPGCNLSQTCTP